MNTIVTSKEEILRASRELVGAQGWRAVSIRSVAAACGVSVGSIYNHFGSKTELAEAVVESVWHEIFHLEDAAAFADTLACIRWIYARMECGDARYPGFFALHSLGFFQDGDERAGGRRRMHRVWRHIRDEICGVLQRDAHVRSDAFSEDLTAEEFADTLFSLVLSALLRRDFNPAPVEEIVRRVVY